MRVELKVPEVGESVIEVQVGQWLKQQGDAVGRDDAVVEIESEKATVELPAPSAGVLVEVLKQEGDTAQVGEVIGYLESNGAESAEGGGGAAATPPAEQTSSAAAPTGNAASDQQRIMPAAQKAMHEHNVSPDQVQASGPGGRVLKEDVLRATEALQRPQARPAANVPAPQAAPQPQRKAPAPSKPAPPAAKFGQIGREDQVVPMTPIRRYIAQRLIEAQQTAALLTTFNEIDMTAVIELRKRYRDVFQEKYGIRLGFMSFFVKACVEALKLYPQINAEIRGTDIVYHNYYDVGIAVGSGKGLVVPIIRNAEYLNFAEVENTIADFGTRAQANKLEMEELKGGTFTISNGGVYGSLLSTPIVNPPQSGILGLHAIQERPMAHEGQVVIRPMMYVALTYDHRIVDGREAVSFLRHVKSCIEEPSRLLLEI